MSDEPVQKYPALPGVIPRLTSSWRRRAMREAHQDLPPMPGTNIHVLFFSQIEGLALIGHIFGDDARDQIAALCERHGPHSVITVATRQPTTRQPRREEP